MALSLRFADFVPLDWTFRKDDETEFHFANAELAVMFAEQNQWKVVDL